MKHFTAIPKTMKPSLFIAVAILLGSCATSLPLLTNLSDQTLLLTENRNIKADYKLTSKLSGEQIAYDAMQKNGQLNSTGRTIRYNATTAFEAIFSKWFNAKFNPYSSEVIKIYVTLEDCYLLSKANNSVAAQLFLAKENETTEEAVVVVAVNIEYKGRSYSNSFESTSSDYNSTVTTKRGTYMMKNQSQQQATLIQNAFNSGIIMVDNMLKQIMMQQ
jgi:hypothetical protein